MGYILLVEDHGELREQIAEALRPAPVMAASCCADALAQLDNHPDGGPSVLVTDVQLRDGKGTDLALAVRRRLGFQLPILFVTGGDTALPPMDVAFSMQKPFDTQLMRTLLLRLARPS